MQHERLRKYQQKQLYPGRLEEAGSAVEPQSTPRSAGTLLVSAAAEAEPNTVSQAMLANQVPPLATFSGEGRDGVTFSDWHEQSDLIAGQCGWSDRVSAVFFTTGNNNPMRL